MLQRRQWYMRHDVSYRAWVGISTNFPCLDLHVRYPIPVRAHLKCEGLHAYRRSYARRTNVPMQKAKKADCWLQKNQSINRDQRTN